MRSTNVIALFCEDIREEKGDIFTLIGLLPDNINLADPAGGPPTPDATRILSRLALYVRVNFDPDADIGAPKVRLIQSDGVEIDIGILDEKLVETARSNAKEKGTALAGVVMRVSLAGFRPPVDGVLKVEVEMKDETYLAGAVTFKLNPPTPTASNASPPPAEQSQPDAS